MEWTENECRNFERTNPFMTYNHIEICSATTEHSVIKVKLVGESMNLRGYVHGGLIFSMMDCAAGVTSRADGRDYVTQSANVNFLRNVTEGTLYARADVIKRGKTMAIIHVEIENEDGMLLADGVVDMICVGMWKKE